MSKIKFGALIVDFRGKTGGTVFSRNKGGAYSKNKVTPANPRTTAQQVQRALLAGFASGWRALTNDQRVAWNGASHNFPMTDVFGDTYFLSGNALHNQLNLNLAKVGIAAITDPPTPEEVYNPALVSYTVTSITNEVVIDSALPANTSVIIRATAPMSPGISNFNSRLRDVVIGNTASTATIDISAEYNAKFGVPPAGSRVGISVLSVNETTGQTGVIQTLSTIVV